MRIIVWPIAQIFFLITKDARFKYLSLHVKVGICTMTMWIWVHGFPLMNKKHLQI